MRKIAFPLLVLLFAGSIFSKTFLLNNLKKLVASITAVSISIVLVLIKLANCPDVVPVPNPITKVSLIFGFINNGK